MCPSQCHTLGSAKLTAVRRLFPVVLLAIAGALAVGRPAPADDDLSALAQAAKQNFQPIRQEQVAAARSDLNRRARDVQRYLGRRGTDRQQWMEHLQWDQLHEALSADGPPDLSKLVVVYRRLNTNKPGLEAQPFRRLSDALQRYIDLAAAADMANPSETYAAQIDALMSDLAQYQADPGPPRDLSIGQRIDFLTSLGQAPELVAAVRGQLAQPNALVNVSSSLLKAGVEKPIDRTETVPDCILGVSISSDTHTVGTVTAATVPCDDRAVLELTSVGHIEAQNRGTKGPAVIRSSSETDYTATKRIEFSDAAFVAHATYVDADLDTDIHSISKKGGGFGSRLVSKMGWSRARQNESRAERIATDHAADRVRNRFDDEAGESLRNSRERYEDEYRAPLERVGALPDHIRFSTTDEELTFEVTQAGRGQLGAPSAPPALSSGHDAVLRLHETAINNYAAAVLGGATARESEPGQKAEFDIALPNWMDRILEDREDTSGDGDEPFKPWSITLRRNRPITVAFADGQVTLTIHLSRLTSGDEQFTRWDVTGTFMPELKDGGVVLHRQDDLVVLPTDFDPESDQLSSRQVALRSNLTKVLNERSAQGRGFSQTITIEALEPSGELKKVGPLDLRQFTSAGGWLTLAWNRQ